ncbi:hypothetical protein [Coleofasciculus sp. E1-EBD-02]|uniref:hypothetical protein n=1 Tax=Coleofasciculus sp. E1-EBD-02 TaxID=3068481 RepID=UPI0032F43A70
MQICRLIGIQGNSPRRGLVSKPFPAHQFSIPDRDSGEFQGRQFGSLIRGNQRQCYPNLNVTLLVFWWAMPTLQYIQGFSDRAMQIFTAIDPNLA